MCADKTDEGVNATGTKRRPLPRIFERELVNMMYGFGDDEQPNEESIRLMEEIVLDYIGCLVVKSTEIAHQHRRERPEVSDIKVIIRKDAPKLNRVRYLLEMKQEIKKVTTLNENQGLDNTNTTNTNNNNNNNTNNNNTNNNNNNTNN